MKKIKFKEIDHTADVGIVAFGESLEEMFENAAYGMLLISYSNLSIDSDLSLKLYAEEPDEYYLLVAWLSEINYLITGQDFLTLKINKIQIKKKDDCLQLEAEIKGTQASTFPDFFNTEIKAVTYHQLKIERQETGYECKVFFDI